ncbi:MAG: HAMP domain-containing histidine kinase, partial [Caldilineaceae bacterium]|nr:HAMP domain-containing histidine kinase [Caldilineaceae bacterium]
MQPFILTSPVQAWFQRHMATAPPPSPAGGSAMWHEAFPLPDMTENAQESTHKVVIIRTFPSQWGSRIEFESPDIGEGMPPAADPLPISSAANIFVPITHSTELWSVQAKAEQTAQPAAHASEAFAEIPRSTRKVETPIGGQETPLGYVELSSGPDYGSPLLNTIWKAFAIAAGSVSLLAVLIGLVVGRGLTAPLLRLTTAAARMSRGDLSSRAAVQSRDEIGALAQQFNQMAMQLENSFAELAAERDTLRRFMADASHELRTPITALHTFLELLGGSAAEDPQAQREFLQESQQQVGKLGRITSSLLDLSRLEGGLGNLQRQPEDVCALVQRAAALFRLAAQEKQIELHVNLPDSPLISSCDGERIESVLTNLLDNALRFAPVGGHVEIGAAATADGRSMRLWVQDNGPG